jgi:hypothetical protein
MTFFSRGRPATEVLRRCRGSRMLGSPSVPACVAGKCPTHKEACVGTKGRKLVLDGVVSSEERQEMLDYVTETGWDHAQGLPQSKWERKCRDGKIASLRWTLSCNGRHAPACAHAGWPNRPS